MTDPLSTSGQPIGPTATKQCGTCQFWHPSNPSEGACRKYAPRPTILLQAPGMNVGLVWPGTKAGEWCGEYEMEEMYRREWIDRFGTDSSKKEGPA